MGPLTRTAIRAFQKGAALRETGEPTRDVFAALQAALARRDASTGAPPPKPEAEAKGETAGGTTAKTESAPARDPSRAAITLGPAEPPPAPTSADFRTGPPAAGPAQQAAPANEPAATAAQPAVEPSARAESTRPPAVFALPAPEAPPLLTSTDILRVTAPPEPGGWPASPADQVKTIQSLLKELKFTQDPPDGVLGPVTQKAIRDYEQSAGLAPTGEPSRALFDSLKSALAAKPN